jgi:dipeptidyl aminopeptidase/acylaminoacyl peptidase
MEIPAFLYLPPNHVERDAPIPFIASYHGGPEGPVASDLQRLRASTCSRRASA